MCKLYSFGLGQGIFSLEVNKPLELQITLGSESHEFGRYATVDDGGNLCHVFVDPSIY